MFTRTSTAGEDAQMALEAIVELLAELAGKGILTAGEVHNITTRAKERAALKSIGRA